MQCYSINENLLPVVINLKPKLCEKGFYLLITYLGGHTAWHAKYIVRYANCIACYAKCIACYAKCTVCHAKYTACHAKCTDYDAKYCVCLCK
jgi:hypothetical protein